MLVKLLHPDANVPRRAHDTDAGFDLTSVESLELLPGHRATIGTGVAVAIPVGWVGLVCDRSGLAAKHGLTNLAGVIDSGYRGEIRVVMLNTGDELIKVSRGCRIAQLVVVPHLECDAHQVSELPDSGRGVAGFGSTGV